MAATITPVVRTKAGKKFIVYANFAWDATYPANGEALTANQLGLGTIEFLGILGSNAGAVYEWDGTNSKIKAYYADYSTATDGLLIEIAAGDTAFLTGVVLPIVAIGT